MLDERYKAPIEIVAEYKKKQQFFTGEQERIRRGHLYFEFEFDTGILQVIPLKNPVTEYTSKLLTSKALPGVPIEEITKRYRVEKRPGCYYFGALNFRTAKEKLAKLMPGISFEKIT